ncbi:hypothetical protein N7533_000771 [Penicillium manginii]|uniref:uncharacterized protein n=1 Tax=Penicillium manginii TaxID=203109 RepID=UPI00254749CF|nr:uncharacterized protein N7533_000771 [Penicillium manginii]KAJ5768188.1 hypothetical protein N7533_000771 [Penicillium manginii]
MPLVILTGYPCSGLSYRANQLASLLEKAQDEIFAATDAESPASLKFRYKIHVVSSHDNSSYPRTVYDHARTEKEARGVAYARAKRVVAKDSIVILDGMNYIKGWRYQLWCESKAAGTSCCVVHVGTPVDQCVANNKARLDRDAAQQKDTSSTAQPDPSSDNTAPAQSSDTEQAYAPELLDNLIFRYEEPSTHSRWDKPLFTVPWEDADPPVLPSAEVPVVTPVSNLIDSLASTNLSSAASTTTTARTFTRGSSIRPRIVAHQATTQAAVTDPGALYAMEKRTTAIVNAIRAFTQSNPSAEEALAKTENPHGIAIDVPEASIPILIPVHVATSGTTDELAGAGGVLAAPKLQRLRRQWISLNRRYLSHGHGEKQGGLAADQVGDAFVRFLNSSIGGEDGEA